jgi:hypothetical protein
MTDDRDLTQASPTGADPDGWDARPADEERAPRDDDRLGPRGTAGEDVGETEGGAGDTTDHERVPGAPHESTADATEGGAGRP